MSDKTRFTMTVEVKPGPAPAINLLRSALKCLLRHFGIVVLSVRELEPTGKPEPETSKKGD